MVSSPAEPVFSPNREVTSRHGVDPSLLLRRGTFKVTLFLNCDSSSFLVIDITGGGDPVAGAERCLKKRCSLFMITLPSFDSSEPRTGSDFVPLGCDLLSLILSLVALLLILLTWLFCSCACLLFTQG